MPFKMLIRAWSKYFAAMILAINPVAQIHNQVEGLVRIAVPENLAYTLVLPALQTLYQQHPKLRIELSTGVEIRNVHRRDVDLAIRTIQPEQGNVTIRRLGALAFAFYGTPHYLQHSDEQDYAYIGWTESQQDLQLARFLKRFLKHKSCVLQCNTLSMQIHAVQQNLGIAILPRFIAQQRDLLRVHPTQQLQQPIWLVAQSHVLSSQRVRTVADHLIALFSEMTMFNDGIGFDNMQ